MNKSDLKKIFKHNRKSWSKISKRGKKYYVLHLGVLKLGILMWFIYKLLTYSNKIDYNLDNFVIIDFLITYLTWLPFTILVGIFIAFYLWNENERKFNDSDKDQ
jgi:ABC-type transport system involved in multi-copper enzyme maturation permease subunit